MDDAQQFFDLAKSEKLASYTMWNAHENIDYTKKHILRLQSGYSRGSCYTWAISGQDGTFMGLISLAISAKHHRAEVGYWLGVPYWNKGYMTQALECIIDFCFDILKLNKVFAQHFDTNLASGKVMQKCGMIFDGTLRQHVYVKNKYQDCKVYSILKSWWDKNHLN